MRVKSKKGVWNHLRGWHLAVGAVVVALGSSAEGEVRYTVTEVPTLGHDFSVVNGINNNGDVVGTIGTVWSWQYGYVFKGGVMLQGKYAEFGSITAINDSGNVVGYKLFSNAAWYYDGGPSLIDVGYLGGGSPNASAKAINNNNVVVGGAQTPFRAPPLYDTEVWHAFSYSGGAIVDLPVYGNNLTGTAYGVNDHGDVVGGANIFTLYPSSGQYSFWIHDGVATNLGSLGSTNGFPNQSLAYAINNNNQIVGSAATYASYGHAYLYEDGVMKDLGAFNGAPGSSAAYDINDSGVIVGTSDGRAFVSDGTLMKDLNLLIDPAYGITLTSAVGVNNSGTIVVNGTLANGANRGFVLTLIPEPGAVLGLVVPGLLFMLRRRS